MRAGIVRGRGHHARGLPIEGFQASQTVPFTPQRDVLAAGHVGGGDPATELVRVQEEVVERQPIRRVRP